METDSRSSIRALRSSQDRLASIVQPLTPEQLRRPSYHSWTIAQVLSHMGSQAEVNQGRITAAQEGTEAPGREAIEPIWEAWNARTPDEQARDSIAYNEREIRRLEGLTDADLSRMHLNLFGMELDGAALVRLWLGEHALHTWDIAVALDPVAQVSPDAAALLIDSLPFLVGFAGKPQDKNFRLRVRTTDPEREYALRVDERVELTNWDGGAADGELRISAEAFLRLVYGRLDPAHTPEVELTGPIALDDLRRGFPGV